MEIPALRQADFIRFGIVIRTAAAIRNFRFGFAPKINELFGSFRTCTLINFICLLRRGDTVNDVGIENLVILSERIHVLFHVIVSLLFR